MENINAEKSLYGVKVPWFVRDEEFINNIKIVSSEVEVLDCSECVNLSQEAFLQLSRDETCFPKLKLLIVPENSPYPDLVYECLSYITPALEQFTNLRQNNLNTCDQLRCLSYFKKSNIKVLQDNPVNSYGRMSSQSNDKQKRQRWEQDLAKIAISCQKIESYKCLGGKGYLDDKSLERLSVLMPGLIDLELRRCSVSDEGLVKFFAYNKSNKLSRIALDDAGNDITDKSLRILAENCPFLTSLTLLRMEKVSKLGIENLLKCCQNLLELELGIGSAKNSFGEDQRSILDEGVFLTIANHCSKLCQLKLLFCDLSLKNILKIVSNTNVFLSLKSLSFHDCQLIGALSFVEFLAQLQNLSELSIVDCRSLSPEMVANLIVKLPSLKRLTLFCQNKSFYSDVAPIAKDAYTMLTSENGGRFKLSGIEHLTVQGVSGQFLRLLTALCSRVTSLDFRLKMLPKVKCSCVMECSDLIEALLPCESLVNLEITSMNSLCNETKQFVRKPKLSNEFFKTVLSRLPHLNKLFVDFTLEDVSKDTVVSFLKDAECLEHLSFNIAGSVIDEESLRTAVEQLRRGRCTVTISSAQDGTNMQKIARVYLKPLKKGDSPDTSWF